MGFQQQAFDQTAEAGFNNAQFEFSEEEIPELLEEFYQTLMMIILYKGQSTSTANTNANNPNLSNNTNNINSKTANGV